MRIGHAGGRNKARERMLQARLSCRARLSIERTFVLQKIAELEKLEIENRDIDEEIERIAETYGESPPHPRPVRAAKICWKRWLLSSSNASST